MSDRDTHVNTGIGLPWTLTIVFIILKLCKIIDWIGGINEISTCICYPYG